MKDGQFRMLRWSPIAASILLILLIAVVSMTTVSKLKKATSWREQTFETILDAQTFEDKLIDAQSNVRNYVGKGESNLLIEYKNDTNIEMREIKQLSQLTSSNPAQQKRLRDLAEAVQAVFSYDDKVLGVYARQGPEAALKMDEADESKNSMDLAIQDLEKFTDEEKKLVTKEDADEQAEYRHAAHLLVYCSILVACLLLLANVVASREMARRRQAEAEQKALIEKLQAALLEVKTLSGLIPICGWCKSVRSDNGYWQSVEQYVRAHTNASFTHGMCPSCSEKFKRDIQKVAGGAGNVIASN